MWARAVFRFGHMFPGRSIDRWSSSLSHLLLDVRHTTLYLRNSKKTNVPVRHAGMPAWPAHFCIIPLQYPSHFFYLKYMYCKCWYWYLHDWLRVSCLRSARECSFFFFVFLFSFLSLSTFIISKQKVKQEHFFCAFHSISVARQPLDSVLFLVLNSKIREVVWCVKFFPLLIR